MPAGTKKDAIQTRSRTAARTVNAVGNLSFRRCGSLGIGPSVAGSVGCGGAGAPVAGGPADIGDPVVSDTLRSSPRPRGEASSQGDDPRHRGVVVRTRRATSVWASLSATCPGHDT